MINERQAKQYCCEDLSLIENYELAVNDTTHTWECHHKLGEQYDRKYLIDNNLYENRPACEFKFVTSAEHNRLHKKGIPLSEANKKAISEAKKGVPNVKLSKKILQFTKSGEFIREWPSISEASHQLKINCGNIGACCTGNRKSAGGYVWKYACYNDEQNPENTTF